MQYKRLGKTDLHTSVLGFGCSHIASMSTRYTRGEVVRSLKLAADEGVNFFDTADIYGQGDSERLLGKVFEKKRHDVIICSKAGLTLSASQNLIRAVKPVLNAIIRHIPKAQTATSKARKEREAQCFEPGYLRARLEGTLKRLRTDYLDIFLLHNPAVDVIESAEIKTLMQQAKSSGKTRYAGISCSTTEEALAAIRCEAYDCIQLPVNIFDLAEKQNVLDEAKQRGVGIIAREPYSGGAILQDDRLQNMEVSGKHIKPYEVALQALFHKDEIGVVLAGMISEKHLRENLRALSAPALDSATLGKILRA